MQSRVPGRGRQAGADALSAGAPYALRQARSSAATRVFDPGFDFDSGAQEPGETVELEFPDTGSFLVYCGIHPKMELVVDVAP